MTSIANYSLASRFPPPKPSGALEEDAAGIFRYRAIPTTLVRWVNENAFAFIRVSLTNSQG